MNTLIRIQNINRSIAENLVTEFNLAIPGFCQGKGAREHLHIKGLYSFFLSSEKNWTIHWEEVFDSLSKISSTLLYAKNLGAELSVNTCIHINDYKYSLCVDFDFPCELLRLITEIGASLEVSLYSICVTCPLEECSCPTVVNKKSSHETNL